MVSGLSEAKVEPFRWVPCNYDIIIIVLHLIQSIVLLWEVSRGNRQGFDKGAILVLTLKVAFAIHTVKEGGDTRGERNQKSVSLFLTKGESLL